MDVGNIIREARLAKGLTQEQLGEVLGVKKSAVAKYENGHVVNIKRTTILKLSETLGIRPADLVGDFAKEKPVVTNGLTKDKIDLINYVQSVPENKAAKALQALKLYLEDD